MKYYAVTDDPRELYHYGVKGMKWGQHIFGPEPGLKKSPAYLNAQRKLRSLSKSATATVKSVNKAYKKTVTKAKPVAKAVAKTIKKSAAQAAYNARRIQDNRFEKSLQKAQAKLDRADVKFNAWQQNQAQRAVDKQISKAVRAVKINNAKTATRNALKIASSAAVKAPGQIAYNVRRAEDNKYSKAVQKAQKRMDLSSALRSLDREEKLYRQADRERKMDALLEKHADIMADNDLKTMRKAVKVEKNMPKYYQQARTGTLPYGKLSDEQIERLQNRLALEANTRRLGSTEEPSWREQKKMARRQGYLQGITKGTSAAMEEVARAGVQYGIKNLANRKKLDAASEYKAEREKTANRIKNQKSRKEVREDFRQDVYEQQVAAGIGATHRGTKFTKTSTAAERLQEAKRIQNENQGKLDEARDDRKFLTEEKHNAAKLERQRQERLAEASADIDQIGKSLHENGYAIVPSYNKDGKKTGVKILTADGSNATKDKQGKLTGDDGPAYLKLYESKYGLDKKKDSRSSEQKEREYLNTISSAMHKPTKEEIKEDAAKRVADYFKARDADVSGREAEEKARQEHIAKVNKANQTHKLIEEKKKQNAIIKNAKVQSRRQEIAREMGYDPGMSDWDAILNNEIRKRQEAKQEKKSNRKRKRG